MFNMLTCTLRLQCEVTKLISVSLVKIKSYSEDLHFFRSVSSSLVQNKGLLYEEYLISTLMFRNMKSGGALLRFAIS